MRKEFQQCNNKSLTTKYMTDKWNRIQNYFLQYHLLFNIQQKFFTLCVYLERLIVAAIPQFNCSYCHHIASFEPISNCVIYLVMNEVLLIVSAITPISAITQFYLFLFTVSITYQNLLLLTLIRQVLLSATHIRSFYLRSNCISNSCKLLLSAHQINYHVVLSSICMR